MVKQVEKRTRAGFSRRVFRKEPASQQFTGRNEIKTVCCWLGNPFVSKTPNSQRGESANRLAHLTPNQRRRRVIQSQCAKVDGKVTIMDNFLSISMQIRLTLPIMIK